MEPRASEKEREREGGGRERQRGPMRLTFFSERKRNRIVKLGGVRAAVV